MFIKITVGLQFYYAINIAISGADYNKLTGKYEVI